jgi:hypothetical protein
VCGSPEEASVGLDQRVGRQRLAAVGGDEDLALRDMRGREIQHQRAAGERDADGEGAVEKRRSVPPKGATSTGTGGR